MTMKIVYFDTKQQLKICKVITNEQKYMCLGDPIGAGVLVAITGPPEIKEKNKYYVSCLSAIGVINRNIIL